MKCSFETSPFFISSVDTRITPAFFSLSRRQQHSKLFRPLLYTYPPPHSANLAFWYALFIFSLTVPFPFPFFLTAVLYSIILTNLFFSFQPLSGFFLVHPPRICECPISWPAFGFVSFHIFLCDEVCLWPQFRQVFLLSSHLPLINSPTFSLFPDDTHPPLTSFSSPRCSVRPHTAPLFFSRNPALFLRSFFWHGAE